MLKFTCYKLLITAIAVMTVLLLYNDMFLYDKIITIPLARSLLCNVSDKESVSVVLYQDVDYRQKLAEEIIAVTREMKQQYGEKQEISKRLFHKLDSIAQQLDARLTAGFNHSTWQKSVYVSPAMPSILSQSGTKRHVCPQVLLNNKKDSPFNQHGIEFTNCNYVPQMREVITFIISLFNIDNIEDIDYLERIQESYNLSVIVLTNSSEIANLNSYNTQYMLANSEGQALNEVLQKVTTPFVLIGQDLSEFNNQSSIKRLIGVLDDLENYGVKIAGGSVRNATGHWTHGCLQFKLANYRAKYKLGYFHSMHECMICDDLLGPFVASTKLMKAIKFDPDISGSVIFRDWFMKFKNTGHLSVVCPDVMFYVENKLSLTRDQWKTFSQRWELVSLEEDILDSKHVHTFTCDELNINCNTYWKTYIRKGLFAPPCCTDAFLGCISNLLSFADANGLQYALQCGTALGALKFGKIIPWDIDADIEFACKDWFRWMKMEDSFLEKNSYKIYIMKQFRYFTVTCNNSFFVEFRCSNIELSSNYLSSDDRNTSTLALLDNSWVQTQHNPGLYSRIEYKLDYTRHSKHWKLFKPTKTSETMGKRYVPPMVWTQCSKPGHHSCQNKYSIDGDIPIFDPFW